MACRGDARPGQGSVRKPTLRDRAWFAKELFLCLLRHDWEPAFLDEDGFVHLICLTCGERKRSLLASRHSDDQNPSCPS